MYKSRGPISIDLFCGAGGLSEGLRAAGFDGRVGVDFDKHALATYAANHPKSRPLLADVSNVTGRELCDLAGSDEVDLIAGGPSCQGFSTHGKRMEDDPRNFLFKHFVRLVQEVRPKFFLMENVKGLLAFSNGYFKNLIESSFSKIGYRVVSSVVCAADYGVPQLRHRVVFIGTRLDDVELSLPAVTHGDNARGLLPYVTVQDAIGDLPLINGDFGKETWPYASRPRNAFQRAVRAGSGPVVSLHQANQLSVQASKIARFVGQGEGLRAVPAKYLPERFRKMRRISTGELRRDCTTLYHRLDPARPAYTITCYYRNIASGPFLHPFEDRSLSHREAARLMSFPDRYEFHGAGIPRQIGNAVPPILGAALGEHMMELLKSSATSRRMRKVA